MPSVGHWQGYLGIFLGAQPLWGTELLLGRVGGQPYSHAKGREPFQVPAVLAEWLSFVSGPLGIQPRANHPHAANHQGSICPRCSRSVCTNAFRVAPDFYSWVNYLVTDRPVAISYVNREKKA